MFQRLMRFAKTLGIDIQDSQVFYHDHMRETYDGNGESNKKMSS